MAQRNITDVITEDRKYLNDTKQYRPVHITRCKRIQHHSRLKTILNRQMKKITQIKTVFLIILIAMVIIFYNKYFFVSKSIKAPVEVTLPIMLPTNESRVYILPLPRHHMAQKYKKWRRTTQIDILQESNNTSGFPLIGENGAGVLLPTNMSAEMRRLVEEGWKKNGFNQYVSDHIRLNRSTPDERDDWCKVPGRFLPNLPATSVVICFHNEAWSTLLRTVHSVLDRSPEKLLKEIILVDDFSDLLHLKTQLVEYLADYPKVRLIRADKREGLIRARLIGLQHVTAPVVTFLDSHCECAPGWLEPLLDRIARNPTTVVCPTIDNIHDTTFHYYWSPSKNIHVGGFNWNLEFRWHSISIEEKERRENKAEPVQSPTMSGGLFSIDKAFFEKLGTYDNEFDIWGGENLELSFKIWMCGGTLEILPCSHVGHVFRMRSPYKWKKGVNVILRNSIRLAEVWLDEYAKYFYEEVNYIAKKKQKIGDLTARKALRKNLGCKSFDWYLKNVFPKLFIPGDVAAKGEIRSLSLSERPNESHYCLDSDKGEETNMKIVKMKHCHGQEENQYWLYTRAREIRKGEYCLDGYEDHMIVLFRCHASGGNQFWKYDPVSKLIRFAEEEGPKCLAIDSFQNILMETCNETNVKHLWHLQNYNNSVSFKV